MFTHKNQKEFYSEYAIKDGQALNENNLNLFNKRLKKEVDDIHNLLNIFAGLKPIEYSPIVEYEDGEIVSYKDKNYIAQVKVQGEAPGSSQKWLELTDFVIQAQGLNRLDDYLSKYNQKEYNPEELAEGENSVAYHPTTVKFVEDRIKWYLKNSVITNADRLDGFHASYFATLEQLQEVENKVKLNDFSRFEPYNIPFTSKDLNVITTTSADKFTSILTIDSFNKLYGVIENLEKYDLRFNESNNKVIAATLESTEDIQAIVLSISGPFKGFGVDAEDYSNGTLGMKITLNLKTNQYSSIDIFSNVSKTLTQEQFNELGNISDFVNYIITSSYTQTEQLVSYLKLFKTKDAAKGLLRWSDPGSLTSRVVYNATREPMGENDGVIIEDSISHNKYAIDGLTVDISGGGFYKIFPISGKRYYNDHRNCIEAIEANIEDLPDMDVKELKVIKKSDTEYTLEYLDGPDYVVQGAKIRISANTPVTGVSAGSELTGKSDDYIYSRKNIKQSIDFTIPSKYAKYYISVYPILFNNAVSGGSSSSSIDFNELQAGIRIDESIANTSRRVKPTLGAYRPLRYFRVSAAIKQNTEFAIETNIPLDDLLANTTADGKNLTPAKDLLQITETDSNWTLGAANGTYAIYHKDFYKYIGKIVIGSGTTTINFESNSIGERQLNDYFNFYPVVGTIDNPEETLLDPSDYTKDTEGNAADISTLGKDVMITVPRKGQRIYAEAWSFYEYERIEDYTISEAFPANLGVWNLKSIELVPQAEVYNSPTQIKCIFENIVGDGTRTEVEKTYTIDKTFNTTATAATIKLNKLRYDKTITINEGNGVVSKISSVFINNGANITATVDKADAYTGDIVYLTCSPSSGYKVSEVSAKNADNIEFYEYEKNKYAFIMPDKPVEIIVKAESGTYDYVAGNPFVIFENIGITGSGKIMQTEKDSAIGELPECPERPGFDFTGWYVEGTSTKIDSTYAITKNVTIEAKYTANTNTIENRGGGTIDYKFFKPVEFQHTIELPRHAKAASVSSILYRSEAQQKYFTLEVTYVVTDLNNTKTTLYKNIFIPWDTSVKESKFDYNYRSDGTKWYIDITNMLLVSNKVQGRLFTGNYLRDYLIPVTDMKSYDSVAIQYYYIDRASNYLYIIYKCTSGDKITYVSKYYALTAANKLAFSIKFSEDELNAYNAWVEGGSKPESIPQHFFNEEFAKIYGIFGGDIQQFTNRGDIEIVNLNEDKSFNLQVKNLITNTQISVGKWVFNEFTNAYNSEETFVTPLGETISWDYSAHTREFDLTLEEYEAVKDLDLADKLAAVKKESQDRFYIAAYGGFGSGGAIYSSTARAWQNYVDLSTSRRYCEARNIGGDRGYCLPKVSWWRYISSAALVVFQDCDIQRKVGYGYGWSSGSTSTGGANALGFNYEFSTDTQRTNGYSQIKILGIEDYYGNMWQWYDGLRTGADSQNLLWANGNFARVDMFETVGRTGSGSSVYFSSTFSNTKGYGIPQHEGSISGSDSTHYGDKYWQAANCAALMGGSFLYSWYCGLLCVYLDCAPSYSAVGVGLRLGRFAPGNREQNSL